MKSACDMNLQQVTFESDAQVVVEAMHTSHVGVSVFSTLISSFKRLFLNSNFEVKFVKPQANLVAHLLARVANSWASRCVFYSIPPRAAISLHFSRMGGVYLIQLE
jgi:hypothetical protein